jgi:hydrogenase expression/formation protein HypE
MEIGKLPNDVLEEIVFSSIKNKRKEVLVRAGVGEDNAIIDFGDDVCVVSTDPITGTTKDIGSLAIYISCNDVASSGAEPIGVLMTIMAPPQTTEEDIRKIMEEAGRASLELNVEIVGGHTEITDAVNRIVVSTTVIGKQPKNKVIDSQETKIGDKVLMTKYVGIEGTSIIAKELEESLKKSIPKELLHEALSLNKYISVAKEGVICGQIGATYMHDITEGGVFGAVWEASRVIKKGIKIKKTAIPMKESTKVISELLDIDPYRLISSGSMLVVASEGNILNIQERLVQAGIESSVIGEVIEEGIYLDTEKGIFEITPPTSDELYKALQR